MKAYTAAGLLSLAASAYAQFDQKCQDGICYSLNIPDSTASSGSGDIYIQISASATNYAWVGLGQGSSMSGANIFVIYTDSTGKNVTVSPRLGSGHSEPQSNQDANIEILEGTGVSGEDMIANFKCSSCSSWSGGSMDFSSSSDQSWIFAYKSGDPLDSDSQSESIDQHDAGAYNTFTFDFSTATGGSSANPFTSSSGSSSGSGSQSCRQRSTTAAGTTATRNNNNGGTTTTTTRPFGGQYTGFPGFTGRRTNYDGPWETDGANKRDLEERALPYCDELSSNSGGSSGFNSIGDAVDYQKQRNILIAHGVIASSAFVVLFPLGAIVIRLLSFPGLIWLHAGLQIFSYFAFIAAVGLGVWVCNENTVTELSDYHPVIGLVLFVLLFIQPILGWLHHAMFKKYNDRTFWSYGHIWLGRIIITLGIVNGGLGLYYARQDAPASTGQKAAYGIVAGIMFLIYLVAIVLGERRRRLQRATQPPKYVRNLSDDPMTPPPPPPPVPQNYNQNYGGRRSMGSRSYGGASQVSPIDGANPHEMEYYGRRK